MLTSVSASGLFSLNVHIPTNGDRHTHLEPDGTPAPFNLFFTVLAIIVVISFGVLALVRFWKDQAEVKWGRINAIRAEGEAHALGGREPTKAPSQTLKDKLTPLPRVRLHIPWRTTNVE